MRRHNFKPQYYQTINDDTTLELMIAIECGDPCAYTSVLNKDGTRGTVRRSIIRQTQYRVKYFIWDNKRCYLDEFKKY